MKAQRLEELLERSLRSDDIPGVRPLERVSVRLQGDAGLIVKCADGSTFCLAITPLQVAENT